MSVQLPSFSLRDLVLSCRGTAVFQDRDEGIPEGSVHPPFCKFLPLVHGGGRGGIQVGLGLTEASVLQMLPIARGQKRVSHENPFFGSSRCVFEAM